MLANCLPVYKDIKVLVSKIMKYYELMPKCHKYRIGAKLYDTSLDLFEYISAANRNANNFNARIKCIIVALQKLQSIITYIELCDEYKILSPKAVVDLTKQSTTIGKQLTAWKNKSV